MKSLFELIYLQFLPPLSFKKRKLFVISKYDDRLVLQNALRGVQSFILLWLYIYIYIYIYIYKFIYYYKQFDLQGKVYIVYILYSHFN